MALHTSMNIFGRKLALIAALASATGLGACATPPSDPEALATYQEINDPLEPTNRAIFGFNMFVDRNVLKPVAKGYRSVVPDPARTGVRNFVDNLKSPLIFANDLLQGEIDRAGVTLVRFVFNSTLGVGGVYDFAAKHGDYHKHSEDLGQTFATYGIPAGPYLMAPFLGPMSTRHAVGRIGEFYADPVRIILHNMDEDWASYTLTGLDVVDARSRNIESFEAIEESAIDLYATLRSAYRQNRTKEIANGRAVEGGNAQGGADDFDFDY